MRILRVAKDQNGHITHLVTENGSIISAETALDYAEQGLIEGVDVGMDTSGEYLYSYLGGNNSTQLEDFPSLR